MIRDYLQEALKILLPETPDWYGWAKTDSNGNKIPDSERMQTQYVIVNPRHEGIVTRPTDQAINDKVAELQAEYDALQYQRDRLAEYPSIQELVVALYDEEDKQALIEKRNAVKAKYPKPT